MAWSKDNGSQSAVNAAQYIDGKKPLIEQAIVDANEAKPIAASAKAESGQAKVTAGQADTKATDALAKATSAKSTAETVQGEFDRVVAEAGSNNPEVVQARGSEATLKARLDKTTAQLADTTQEIKTVNYETKGIQQERKRPIVTFISDDGSIEDWNKLRPLSIQYNIPFVAAIISSFKTGLNNDYTKLKYLQNDLGWEIASHTVNHVDLGTLNEAQLEIELKNSKDTLTANGLRVKNIVYPFGGSSAVNRRIAKKYYRAGVSVSHIPNTSLKAINNGVIPSFNIRRVGIGSWFDYAEDGLPATNTLEYYKIRVDQCLAQNGWLVFMLHPGEVSHDATQQSYLEQIIQYVKSKNIEVLTLDKAFDIFGNVIEVGDYNANYENVYSGKAVNKFGDTANMENVVTISNTGLTNTSLIKNFPDRLISITNFNYSTTNGFPTSFGTLMTHRIATDINFHYQLWFDYNSAAAVYRRIWKDGAWLSWDKVIFKSDLDAIKVHNISNPNIYNASTLPNMFPVNKITTTVVSGAGNITGMPNSAAGILTTYRVGSDEFDRQEYRKYNSFEVWSRLRTVGVDAWGTWTKISVV